MHQNTVILSKFEKSWNQTKREKEAVLLLPKSYLEDLIKRFKMFVNTLIVKFTSNNVKLYDYYHTYTS